MKNTSDISHTHNTQNTHTDALFERSVADFIDPDGKFREKLRRKMLGKYEGDIVIKFGADPTRPDIHLGHAVILRRLRQLQDLGCKVVFLIGDFTAHIGDPTGKSKVRPEMEQEAIERNLATYVEQAGKILRTDAKSFSWIRNSDWYYGVTDMQPREGLRVSLQDIFINPRSFAGKAILYENTRMQKTHLKRADIHDVTLRGLLATLRHISYGRLIQRDMFQERVKNGQELFLHEMIYPVLQGIDSYLISLIYGSCDLEIGGSDQHFNMLMGRDVLRANGMPEQSVLSLKLLTGLDGTEKMSKSLENYIAITDAPNDMYGKVMSLPDGSLAEYFELCTYTSPEEVKELLKSIQKGGNPRDVKMRLAREIVSIFHGEMRAKQAQDYFVSVFQNREMPKEMPVLALSSFLRDKQEDIFASEILEAFFASRGEAKSKGDIRRLFEQGAVSYRGKKLENPNDRVSPALGDVVKVGKKQWFALG